MALCERCGSIQISKAQAAGADKLVALFSSKRPFLCRRCGWRGRREWSDADLQSLQEYGAGGAEPDPALRVLDEQISATRQLGREATQSKKYKEVQSESAFDLGKIDLTSDVSVIPTETTVTTSNFPRYARTERRWLQKRRRRFKRREIAATVLVTAVLLGTFALIAFTGSCSIAG